MDAARASAKTRLWLRHEAESRAGQAIGQSCDIPLYILLEGPNLNFSLLKSSLLDSTKLRNSNILLDSILI